jgi:hypothetical protein
LFDGRKLARVLSPQDDSDLEYQCRARESREVDEYQRNVAEHQSIPEPDAISGESEDANGDRDLARRPEPLQPPRLKEEPCGREEANRCASRRKCEDRVHALAGSLFWATVVVIVVLLSPVDLMPATLVPSAPMRNSRNGESRGETFLTFR